MNWWQEFYDEKLAAMLLRTKDLSAEEGTLSFLKQVLHIDPSSRIFDQCCGEGRLSLPLSIAGHSVIGVDQCQAYIDRANHLALSQKGQNEAAYFCKDAFSFLPDQPVDAAFNWWTSFGYALSDEENIKMIRCAFASLKEGGYYALDFLNAPNILANFKPSIFSEIEYEKGRLKLERKSAFDFSLGTFTTSWDYTIPNGEHVLHHSRVRMYMPVDLVDMFTSIGFVDITLFGDVDMGPLTLQSPRCIVVARKALC